MPTWASLSFQNANSPFMEQLVMFHDYSMTLIILITSIVMYSMTSILTNKIINSDTIESHDLELFWTVSPSFILIALGIPSIRLLYLLDEVFNPMVSMKTTGHQWYWSYEYSDFSNVEFDSFMKPQSNMNEMRLIDTDNQAFTPKNTQIRNIITAADVLHAWTIPSLGIKVDAVPGRLNQINFMSPSTGSYHGQCSEICGANHSFMPITLNSVNTKMFVLWIKKMI